VNEAAGRRILIVGGGYIGLYTAYRLERRLRGSSHTLTIVNPENYMQYQPFLPEVASGTIDPRAVVVPLRRVLRRTRVVVGEVERIDHARRAAHVLLPSGERRELAYDIVVLGAGSRSRVLPVPGLAEHAVGFKTVAEAIWLRNRVLSQLDLAAETDDVEARHGALTFVFVGAGFAGIEALGELEDLARGAIRRYPELNGMRTTWLMVEATPRILPEVGGDLADYAKRVLESRGIEFAMDTRLEAIEDGIVRLSDGRAILADTVVWTAGVKAAPLASDSGLPVDDRGRIKVDATLRVENTPNAWAAGDAAAVPDLESGGLSPATAQHAIRQAKRIADNIVATLDGRETEPFRYRNKGALCSLGHFKGVANPMGIKIKGFTAWFLHRTYHLFYMPTLMRKVRIALDWTVALLFPRDIAQLGSLEHPRDEFRRAAGN